ncbi:hypothetical protein Z517_07170 [Fonsecaea pedrosoi CBS 271.37]|uniref:BZIP domain-containing protein n=1 Tax=Fonsecaea pedrosoi CBS 271.37 TaxID=1442368 RepID=A0A0D2H7G2_9EURO|nr:uncharacterized protein Z517_07170 [Fonsecaea pedrosoi CBS 271.37]KIW80554.1 hypothetical protein Z517_07170 [Fonsecaea pedrosoi CBS 271.37]
MAQISHRPDIKVYDDITLPSVLSLRLQNEMHGPDDDWSGTTDPAKRRKIQNRLHQRAWRRRQVMQRKLGVTAKDPSADSEVVRQASRTRDTSCSEASEPPINLWRCSDDVDKTQRSLARFEEYAYSRYLEGSPRTDLLLTLIKFNVFRALMANDKTLGFVNQWLQCEAISPFFRSPDGTQAAVQTCPANLRPTNLQLIVAHHPWIDLLPDPRMRNNILLLGDDYDDEPLCHDVVDNRHGKQSESLIVWGDPCDPDSWEIGEDFCKKWPWVVQGCHRLFKATNNWRVRRGEPKLFPDTICTPR